MRWPSLRSRSAGAGRAFVLNLDGRAALLPRPPHSRGGVPAPRAALRRRRAAPDRPRRSPPVSSVVWASYANGMNPGRHGVYGLVERRPGGYEPLLTGSSDLAAPTLWDVARPRREVDRRRERPRHLAAASGARGADRPGARRDPRGDRLPARLGSFLRGIGYRLDVDTRAGLEGNKDDLLTDLDRRAQALRGGVLAAAPRAVGLLSTARQRDRPHQPLPLEGLRARHAGLRAGLPLLLPHAGRDDRRAADACAGGGRGLLLSGNGFRRLRREIYLNRALKERGWLEFERGDIRRLMFVPDSRATAWPRGASSCT